ncbi:MAG: cell division protein FtsZ [Campylobacterales bacterium]
MDIVIQETEQELIGPRIKVIGVGGGGGNMISHTIRTGSSEDVELICANTDMQALKSCLAPQKLQLGGKLSKGLGAGMKPDIGRESALEGYDEIKDALKGADIVFLAAGLGGGTGTGAAPVVAQAAKEIGALTVSVVTKPFRNEGNKRMKLADSGLAELKKESDSIVVIPNDKLLSIIPKGMGIRSAFRIVDDVLARAVNGMSRIILQTGESDINVDFADVRTIMSHRGLALLGVGESAGNNAAYEAIKNAVDSPLFDNMSINGAMGVLVHFKVHPDYPMDEMNEALGIVHDTANEDADVIFGTTSDESLDKDCVEITIVATGFEKDILKASPSESALRMLNFGDEAPSPQENEAIRKATRKVSGGFDIDIEDLDTPTYHRRRMD